MNTKHVFFCFFFAGAFLLFCTNSTRASVGFSTVYVVPAEPTISDFINVTAGGWTGYAMNEFLLGSQIARTGTNIFADYYFIFVNPGDGAVLPIAGEWDSIDAIGYLPVGQYTLYARTWLAESSYPPILPGDFSFYTYQLTDQRTIYFEVIPEPATFLLLAFSACLGYCRKK